MGRRIAGVDEWPSSKPLLNFWVLIIESYKTSQAD